MVLSRKLTRLHQVVKAYAVIFVIWGLYRLVFRLPEVIEETILKPLVFIGVVMLTNRPQRWDRFFLQIWGKGDWIKALFMGIVFGLLYVFFYGLASFLTFNSLKLGSDVANQLWVSFLGIGLVTAVWEEWLFAGYIFQELKKITSNLMTAQISTAFLFALVHVPILAMGYGFTGTTLIFQLSLLFILGFINTILIGLSQNLLAPILSHTLWGIALFLFR